MKAHVITDRRQAVSGRSWQQLRKAKMNPVTAAQHHIVRPSERQGNSMGAKKGEGKKGKANASELRGTPFSGFAFTLIVYFH